jgi:hypothetical protein
MKSDSLAFAMLLVAALLLGPVAQGLPREKERPKEKKSQYWIVLLDVSRSSDQREHALSQRLNNPKYRLRNEILSLLQTSLAAHREREQGTRDDYLDVYVFGKQVKQVTQLPIHPVEWSDIKKEDWWNKTIPTGLESRTNYLDAIRTAVESFQVKHEEAGKNLVLISDGELDLEPNNRQSRGKLGAEEISAYRNFLRSDNPLLSWMNRHEVAVYTLTMDEALQGPNDEPRQEEIRNRLSQTQLGGTSPLERALRIVEKLNASASTDGLLPESEGPYVMEALAENFAERTRGRARSVRYDNVLHTLWETIFPEETHHRILPLGTKKVILFAPRESPVQVKLRKEGEPYEVSLRYNSEDGSYVIDPAEARNDVDVQLRTTSQYATWVIYSPFLAEVGFSPEVKLLEEQFSLIPVTNVRFEWQPSKPPERVLAGAKVDLALDLMWRADLDGPSVKEWRQALQGVPRRASGQIVGPGTGPKGLSYSIEVPRDDSEAVLRLRSRYDGAQIAGLYQATANFEVGPQDRAWPLKALPVSFHVMAESPLSDPGRFSLGLRIQRRSEMGDLVPVSPPPQGQGAAPLKITTETPARLIFEWSADPNKKCAGMEQLQIVVPELDRTFEPSQNQLAGGKPVLEGNRLVCYRSTPQLLPDDAYNRVLTIRASDGLISWERTFTLQAPRPLWQRVVFTGGLVLLLLLLIALIALVVSQGLRDLLRRRWEACRADFPLAIETGGERVEWQRGKPKRFLVTVDRSGKPEARLTKAKWAAGEQGFEVLPVSSDEYRIRLLAGPVWRLRRIPSSGSPSSPRPLGNDGEIVSFIELARGTRVELDREGTATVVLRHNAR